MIGMIAAALLTASLFAAPPPGTMLSGPPAASYRMQTSGIEALRSTMAAPRAGGRRLARVAAGLGASLAWDLADLPSRRARLPEPVGAFVPGALFGTRFTHGAGQAGGILEARIQRWNTIYPPYAFAATPDR